MLCTPHPVNFGEIQITQTQLWHCLAPTSSKPKMVFDLHHNCACCLILTVRLCVMRSSPELNQFQIWKNTISVQRKKKKRKKSWPPEHLVAFERAEFCSVPEIAHSEAHWAAFPALRYFWKGRNATETSSKGALRASVLEQGDRAQIPLFFSGENTTWSSHPPLIFQDSFSCPL